MKFDESRCVIRDTNQKIITVAAKLVVCIISTQHLLKFTQ